jgi:hypothetical protein
MAHNSMPAPAQSSYSPALRTAQPIGGGPLRADPCGERFAEAWPQAARDCVCDPSRAVGSDCAVDESPVRRGWAAQRMIRSTHALQIVLHGYVRYLAIREGSE